MMLSGQSAGLQVKYFWGAGSPLHVGIFSLVFGGLVVKKKRVVSSSYRKTSPSKYKIRSR